MNYSQRKHLERIRAQEPPYRSDPFGLRPSKLFGMDVIVSPDVPRYELPAEVAPGIPWPPGFREEINRWSRSFLGTTNVIPRGTVYMIGNTTAVMRHEDVVRINMLA